MRLRVEACRRPFVRRERSADPNRELTPRYSLVIGVEASEELLGLGDARERSGGRSLLAGE